MPTLYFMHREFAGHSFQVRKMLEDAEFRALLTFDDSWYFLHYSFFIRDGVGSETCATVRTHLYNLASALHRHFEILANGDPPQSARLLAIAAELVDIAAYSRDFSVCLWGYGDAATRDSLAGHLALLPSAQQMEHFLNLPHMLRHERDRLSYRCSDDKAALKRYRDELADYNRRRKLAAKADQRAGAREMPPRHEQHSHVGCAPAGNQSNSTMNKLTSAELFAFARTMDGETLHTLARRKPFTIHVEADCIRFTSPTIKGPRSLSLAWLDKICDEYSITNSLRPGDYHDITFDSSYAVALIAALLARRDGRSAHVRG